MLAEHDKFSVMDLLDLPPIEQEVWRALFRIGPATTEALGKELKRELSQIENSLAALERKARICLTSDGRWQVMMGHIGPHTTLPASVWPALLGTDRIYSEQEIVTLRTAVPILQFARAKLSEFVDHGPNHALRVKTFATQLSYILGLTDVERHLLRVAALFHDIGNVVDRTEHHVFSQKTVEQLYAAGKLPFSMEEAELIALLCRWHRREYDPNQTDRLRGQPVRTGLIASILRVADAIDIDQRRSDYHGKFREILEFFFPAHLPHWTSLEQILGVRIQVAPTVTLEVFARGPATGNLQIDMLRRDLEGTPFAGAPFDWTVTATDVTEIASMREDAGGAPTGRALLVLPFEAHSLVMGALSRKHLAAAGYQVDLLCYPDAADSPSWLYRQALPGISAARYKRILLLGDRPDQGVTPDLMRLLERWRQSGVDVSVLNRHEGNWQRLPGLLALQVEVILGGDWAYFWGQAPSEVDLAWARIGALCARDPTQCTVGMTPREQAVMEGLLAAVYKALTEPPGDSVGAWLTVAEPILDRIAADDRAHFMGLAGSFREICESVSGCGQVEGQVVVFDEPPGRIPQAYYWIMEAAIEAGGRVPDRGLRFNVPYAVVRWPTQDGVEVLAISHWREEQAIPIRLLYPSDVGPRPEGDECAVRIRMSREQAPAVIPAIVAACNQAQPQ
jgi:hypothetical protein